MNNRDLMILSTILLKRIWRISFSEKFANNKKKINVSWRSARFTLTAVRNWTPQKTLWTKWRIIWEKFDSTKKKFDLFFYSKTFVSHRRIFLRLRVRSTLNINFERFLLFPTTNRPQIFIKNFVRRSIFNFRNREKISTRNRQPIGSTFPDRERVFNRIFIRNFRIQRGSTNFRKLKENKFWRGKKRIFFGSIFQPLDSLFDKDSRKSSPTASSREPFCWVQRKVDFDRWSRPPALPKNISTISVKNSDSNKSSTPSPLVADEKMHFLRRSTQTELTISGRLSATQLDRLTGLLKDKPVKKGLLLPKSYARFVRSSDFLTVVFSLRLIDELFDSLTRR